MFSINKICPLSLIILDSCTVTIIVCINTILLEVGDFFLLFFSGNTKVTLLEQELATLSVHMSSTPVLVGFVLLNLCFEFDTTGVTSRAGTATLSEHMSSTPVCSGVLVAESLALCI